MRRRGGALGWRALLGVVLLFVLPVGASLTDSEVDEGRKRGEKRSSGNRGGRLKHRLNDPRFAVIDEEGMKGECDPTSPARAGENVLFPAFSVFSSFSFASPAVPSLRRSEL